MLQSESASANDKLGKSESEDLELVGVADGEPLLLEVGPGEIGNLVVGLVLEEGRLVLGGAAGARSEVPDVGLGVIADSAHVDCGLRSPGDGVDAVLVVAEAHDGDDGLPGWGGEYLESMSVT